MKRIAAALLMFSTVLTTVGCHSRFHRNPLSDSLTANGPSSESPDADFAGIRPYYVFLDQDSHDYLKDVPEKQEFVCSWGGKPEHICSHVEMEAYFITISRNYEPASITQESNGGSENNIVVAGPSKIGIRVNEGSRQNWIRTHCADVCEYTYIGEDGNPINDDKSSAPVAPKK